MNYEQLKEDLVSHIVLMAQLDADYARASVKIYTSIENFPFPDLAAAVKQRIDELGIELPPKQPTPWFMQVDHRGYRIKPIAA